MCRNWKMFRDCLGVLFVSLCTLSPFFYYYFLWFFAHFVRPCANVEISPFQRRPWRGREKSKQKTIACRPMFASTQSAVQKKKKKGGRTGDHSRKSTRRNLQPPRLSYIPAHSPRLDLNLIRSCIEFKDFSKKKKTFSASPPPQWEMGKRYILLVGQRRDGYDCYNRSQSGWLRSNNREKKKRRRKVARIQWQNQRLHE